ncbi:response regulator [Bradyrhizobium barranii subsp. barranii]|uniref:Response regulator n=1 Tax=Bradyrhizobium barranii subsp. barranii TaxID=2823807 RepID=A0A7Z0QEB6_9BRAD|nr:response regulator [Bradyrhizobium barranii]UGX91121.1 response regulator [Bradyrhizobium barranii subsp. barranii]
MISIIDDDAAVREMLVSLVRSLGYDAVSFDSAESFLANEDFERFTCAITDIHMPGLSGFDLKERLDERKSLVPVIMITAQTEPDLEERARSQGVLGFMRKPLEIELLISYLKTAVGH